MLVNHALNKTHLVKLFYCNGRSEIKHFRPQFSMATFI